MFRNLLRAMNLYLTEPECTDLLTILDPHSLGSFHISALTESLVNLMTGTLQPFKLEEALRKLDMDEDGRLHIDELRYFVDTHGDQLQEW